MTVVDDDEGVDLGGRGRADRACGGAGRGGRCVGERAVNVDGDGATLRGGRGPAVGAASPSGSGEATVPVTGPLTGFGFPAVNLADGALFLGKMVKLTVTGGCRRDRLSR